MKKCLRFEHKLRPSFSELCKDLTKLNESLNKQSVDYENIPTDAAYKLDGSMKEKINTNDYTVV